VLTRGESVEDGFWRSGGEQLYTGPLERILELLSDPSMHRGELWNCGDGMSLEVSERRAPGIYVSRDAIAQV
jgi:hypothetical protein